MQTEIGWYDEKFGNQIKAENYRQTKQDPEYLSHWQNIIYQIISEHPTGICDKEIKQIIYEQFEIQLPISSINARRNELIQKQKVTAVGYIEYPDHNNVLRKNTLWGLL